jgi:uncharacterized ion transporter superfamily protein YfcC
MSIRVPHTFVLIFMLIAVMAVLTYMLPAGAFERTTDEATGRQVIVKGSYRSVEPNPQNVLSVLAAPLKGLVAAAEVVAFVLIVGGAFGIIEKTGAIRAGIGTVVHRLESRTTLIIPLCTLLFGLGGTTIGMSEETIPFYMIFIPLMLALGYDSMVAVAIIFIGSTMGAVGSTLNPFVTGIAQALVGLSPGSGVGFRAGIWVLFMAITITYVMWYAQRVRGDASRSLVREADRINREHFLDGQKQATEPEFSTTHKLSLVALALALGVITLGVLHWSWYVTEIGACFLALAIAVSAIARLSSHEACHAFIDGTREMMSAVLVIGFARGVMVVAQEGYILDTLLFRAAGLIENLPTWLFLNLVFAFQFLFGLLVPSSSAAAATTMPVMGPLADLAGVAQQQNVTAFQLGHGIAILFTPTAGPLVAGLAIAGIPWTTFMRFIAPLIGILVLAALVVLAVGNVIPY